LPLYWVVSKAAPNGSSGLALGFLPLLLETTTLCELPCEESFPEFWLGFFAVGGYGTKVCMRFALLAFTVSAIDDG